MDQPSRLEGTGKEPGLAYRGTSPPTRRFTVPDGGHTSAGSLLSKQMVRKKSEKGTTIHRLIQGWSLPMPFVPPRCPDLALPPGQLLEPGPMSIGVGACLDQSLEHFS